MGIVVIVIMLIVLFSFYWISIKGKEEKEKEKTVVVSPWREGVFGPDYDPDTDTNQERKRAFEIIKRELERQTLETAETELKKNKINHKAEEDDAKQRQEMSKLKAYLDEKQEELTQIMEDYYAETIGILQIVGGYISANERVGNEFQDEIDTRVKLKEIINSARTKTVQTSNTFVDELEEIGFDISSPLDMEQATQALRIYECYFTPYDKQQALIGSLDNLRKLNPSVPEFQLEEYIEIKGFNDLVTAVNNAVGPDIGQLKYEDINYYIKNEADVNKEVEVYTEMLNNIHEDTLIYEGVREWYSAERELYYDQNLSKVNRYFEADKDFVEKMNSNNFAFTGQTHNDFVTLNGFINEGDFEYEYNNDIPKYDVASFYWPRRTRTETVEEYKTTNKLTDSDGNKFNPKPGVILKAETKSVDIIGDRKYNFNIPIFNFQPQNKLYTKDENEQGLREVMKDTNFIIISRPKHLSFDKIVGGLFLQNIKIYNELGNEIQNKFETDINVNTYKTNFEHLPKFMKKIDEDSLINELYQRDPNTGIGEVLRNGLSTPLFLSSDNDLCDYCLLTLKEGEAELITTVLLSYNLDDVLGGISDDVYSAEYEILKNNLYAYIAFCMANTTISLYRYNGDETSMVGFKTLGMMDKSNMVSISRFALRERHLQSKLKLSEFHGFNTCTLESLFANEIGERSQKYGISDKSLFDFDRYKKDKPEPFSSDLIPNPDFELVKKIESRYSNPTKSFDQEFLTKVRHFGMNRAMGSAVDRNLVSLSNFTVFQSPDLIPYSFKLHIYENATQDFIDLSNYTVFMRTEFPPAYIRVVKRYYKVKNTYVDPTEPAMYWKQFFTTDSNDVRYETANKYHVVEDEMYKITRLNMMCDNKVFYDNNYNTIYPPEPVHIIVYDILLNELATFSAINPEYISLCRSTAPEV